MQISPGDKVKVIEPGHPFFDVPCTTRTVVMSMLGWPADLLVLQPQDDLPTITFRIFANKCQKLEAENTLHADSNLKAE